MPSGTGCSGRVVDPAPGAEQHPVLGQKAVVEQQPARIPDLEIASPIGGFALRLAQLPSDDDVGEHRQQPAVRARVQPITRIAVAGNDDLSRPDQAAGGPQEMTPAVPAPFQNRRSAMEHGAVTLGSTGEAAAVLHGVEREPLVMKQRAMGFTAYEISLVEFGLSEQPAIEAEELLQLPFWNGVGMAGAISCGPPVARSGRDRSSLPATAIRVTACIRPPTAGCCRCSPTSSLPAS